MSRTNLTLVGARVVKQFRDELFDAADREGVSVNEFVLQAAAEKLIRKGATIPGVFRSGDIMEARDAR